jgi:hypothetical protein
VVESLGSVPALTRIPVINDYLNCHLASPLAARAFSLVSSCCQLPMSVFPVDWERQWNTSPRARLCRFLHPTLSDFQIADIIEINGLKPRIGNRQHNSGYSVTCLELMFGVSAFPYANEKFSGLSSDTIANPERPA